MICQLSLSSASSGLLAFSRSGPSQQAVPGVTALTASNHPASPPPFFPIIPWCAAPYRQIPAEKERRYMVDRTARYVAKDGQPFEQRLLDREAGNPDFAFLFEYESKEGQYYRWKVHQVLKYEYCFFFIVFVFFLRTSNFFLVFAFFFAFFFKEVYFVYGVFLCWFRLYKVDPHQGRLSGMGCTTFRRGVRARPAGRFQGRSLPNSFQITTNASQAILCCYRRKYNSDLLSTLYPLGIL